MYKGSPFDNLNLLLTDTDCMLRTYVLALSIKGSEYQQERVEIKVQLEIHFSDAWVLKRQ